VLAEAALHVEVRARIDGLRALLSGQPAPDVLAAARDVVVLASSSRGGSSIFAEVLRRSPSLLHFRGETNPAFRLHGLDREASDALPADTLVPAGLGRALGWECGQPTSVLDGDADTWRFAVELAVRLTLQWPLLAFGADDVHAAVQSTLAGLRADAGWPLGRFVDTQAFHARFLGVIRARWPDVHPGAYDIDRGLILQHCPGPWPEPFLPVALVEEPPFVLLTPWRVATQEQLATMPLVIKTPSNAYRMAFLRACFASARVRTLHLVRNGAASINGLYDGWRYPGFHAHRAPSPLRIAGYSDVVPGGETWWKFDRPPGWQAMTSAPLAEVCAFQWRSAHAAILASPGDDLHRLRFEDVLGEKAGQDAALGRLGAWLGAPVRDELAPVLAGSLPVVMATAPPRARRWFSRVDLLGPMLEDPAHLALMEALGYDADPATWG